MLSHYLNGNFSKVQKILRNKRVESTMKYIQLLNLEDDDFDVTSAIKETGHGRLDKI
jgi:hypothetical protein